MAVIVTMLVFLYLNFLQYGSFLCEWAASTVVDRVQDILVAALPLCASSVRFVAYLLGISLSGWFGRYQCKLLRT